MSKAKKRVASRKKSWKRKVQRAGASAKNLQARAKKPRKMVEPAQMVPMPVVGEGLHFRPGAGSAASCMETPFARSIVSNGGLCRLWTRAATASLPAASREKSPAALASDRARSWTECHLIGDTPHPLSGTPLSRQRAVPRSGTPWHFRHSGCVWCRASPTQLRGNHTNKWQYTARAIWELRRRPDFMQGVVILVNTFRCGSVVREYFGMCVGVYLEIDGRASRGSVRPSQNKHADHSRIK